MATIDYTITEFKEYPHVFLISWLAMANGDVGRPIEFMEHADRTVQVIGTFGVGGTVVWEGTMLDSVADADYDTLNDTNDDAMSYTAAKTETAKELTRKTRPRVTAGDGATALNVHALIRRNRP